MITIYHGSNIDAVNWKIYVDNINNEVKYFLSGAKAIDVADRLCQYSIFDDNKDNEVFVVNIDDWKLTDSSVKRCIHELHALERNVIFAIESTTVKNKIFSELKIKLVKATAVNKKSKAMVINKFLVDADIHLSPTALETLISLLPEKIDFIKNEIQKMKLLGQKSFTKEQIKQIVFDLGDANIFNIADSWLSGNQDETISRLNDLLSKNVTINAFIPVFALKLIQIKFFLMAKLAHWSSEIITAKQSLPFWQQSNYAKLKPYDENLIKINKMLDQLYQFDINVKKQRNIPYTQLIKILFE